LLACNIPSATCNVISSEWANQCSSFARCRRLSPSAILFVFARKVANMRHSLCNLKGFLFVIVALQVARTIASCYLDLPQVDLMKRPFLRERATKSREVDLSRLQGFRFRFAPKTRSGVTCNWCLRLLLEVLGCIEWRKLWFPLRPRLRANKSNVCASLNRRKCKFVYSVPAEVITDKDFRRKLMISGGQKSTKACLNLAV